MRTTECVCSLEDYRAIKETKEYRHTPLSFFEHLFKDQRLSQTAKLAWIALSNCSTYNPDFKVRISPRTLGIKLGKGKETARRALKELSAYGYIEAELSNQTQQAATVWVRFPEESVQKILQQPDRVGRGKNIFKLVPKAEPLATPCLLVEQPASLETFSYTLEGEQPINSTEAGQIEGSLSAPPELQEPSSQACILAEELNFAPVAQNCDEGGSKTSHINTNNTNDVYKRTNTSNLASTNTPPQSPVEGLLELECLFKKFVERARELEQSAQDQAAFKTALWQPYSPWEQQAIQAFSELQNPAWEVREAMVARAEYEQLFKQAREAGLSPLQAASQVQQQFSSQKMALNNQLQMALGRLAYLLAPVKSEAKPASEEVKVVSLNAQPKISLNQTQVRHLATRVQQAYQRQELQGQAARTELKTLVEQLKFHAEHWVPSALQFKTMEERVRIAISVGLKRMKAGNWSAPYGWSKRQSLQREQQSAALKRAWG